MMPWGWSYDVKLVQVVLAFINRLSLERRPRGQLGRGLAHAVRICFALAG
jgi:hypothetical protein